MTKVFWVPVQVVQSGFARIEGVYTPEEAINRIENGDFMFEECIAVQVESVEITGAPSEEIAQ